MLGQHYTMRCGGEKSWQSQVVEAKVYYLHAATILWRFPPSFQRRVGTGRRRQLDLLTYHAVMTRRPYSTTTK
jgi:hypothetical protein